MDFKEQKEILNKFMDFLVDGKDERLYDLGKMDLLWKK